MLSIGPGFKLDENPGAVHPSASVVMLKVTTELVPLMRTGGALVIYSRHCSNQSKQTWIH
jgi:hypothetical protein